MKRAVLSFIFLGIFYNAFSQSDFRSAFIITHLDDTVKGQIDYNKPYSCKFKKTSAQNEFTIYKPTDIKGYGFYNDKCFLSKETYGFGDKMTKRFLECLVTGSTSLYKYQNIFLIEKADTLYRLEQKKTMLQKGDVSYVHLDKKYIGTLRYLLLDCKDIGQINNVKLNEKPLIKLIAKYNKCISSDFTIYKKEKPWIRAELGAYSGWELTTIKFHSSHINYEFLDLEPKMSSSSFTIGAVAYIYLPRVSEKLSLLIGTYYFSTEFNVSRSIIMNPNSIIANRITQYHYASFSTKELKIPIGVQYNFPFKGFKPYLNTGITIGKYLDKNTEWRMEEEFNNFVSTYYQELFTFNDPQLGVWLGIGISTALLRKLDGFIELRYEYTGGIVHKGKPSLTSDLSNFSIVFGVKIGNG